jgi:uroporphyrinogen-III decarboxylase
MTALRREEPDRVPIFELIINEPVIKALHPDLVSGTKYQRGSEGIYEIQANFIEREDLDAIVIFEDMRCQ